MDLAHPESGVVETATFSADATRVLTTTRRSAYMWDVKSQTIDGKVVLSARMVGKAALSPGEAAVLSPNGQNVLTGSYLGEARVLNFSRASTSVVDGVLAGRGTAAFSADSGEVVVATFVGVAKVFDVKSGAELRDLPGHSPRAHEPGNRSPGQEDRDGWSRRHGQTLGPIHLDASVALTGHEKAVTWAAFDRTGAKLVTSSQDATARVWDATTGSVAACSQARKKRRECPLQSKLRAYRHSILQFASPASGTWRPGRSSPQLKGHTGLLETVEFNPSGTKVLTASHDKTARIWDAASGKEIIKPLDHTGPVVYATFGDNGSRIVTASYDRYARVWDADTGKLIACSQGAYRRREFGRIQPRWRAHPDGLARQDSALVGCAHGRKNRNRLRAHCRGPERSIQPRRNTGGHHLRRRDGAALGSRLATTVARRSAARKGLQRKAGRCSELYCRRRRALSFDCTSTRTGMSASRRAG